MLWRFVGVVVGGTLYCCGGERVHSSRPGHVHDLGCLFYRLYHIMGLESATRVMDMQLLVFSEHWLQAGLAESLRSPFKWPLDNQFWE